jgi:hypothetical protein
MKCVYLICVRVSKRQPEYTKLMKAGNNVQAIERIVDTIQVCCVRIEMAAAK